MLLTCEREPGHLEQRAWKREEEAHNQANNVEDNRAGAVVRQRVEHDAKRENVAA